MKNEPTEAIISVTNRCDARCRMCNIWRMERSERLSAEHYQKLPNTLKNVNITGGEALLRPDIVEIVQSIYESAGKPRIILASNGFRSEKTILLVQQMRTFVPNLGLALSLDGLAEEHDRIRGVPAAFARAVETLRSLIAMGITDLRIGFTATAANIDQLPAVHRLATELGVEFTATVAQRSETYYGITDLDEIPFRDVAEYFGYLIEQNLRSPVVKNWFRAYFAHGVVKFAEQGRRMSACSAGSDFFYLSPLGDVYPCLTLPHKLGNIRTETFERIWHGDAAGACRGVVTGCRACWMVCTARTELKKAPVRAVSWVVKQQLSRAFSSRRGDFHG